jgi:CheY-like chemotaxis protein
MKILLIDDDKDDQTLFCEAVKVISLHIQCEVAGNGEEGLTLLNNYQELPGLIFLDINMPIMDGRETLNIIKASTRLQSLPVIMYSTSSSRDEIEKFMLQGVQYIVKGNSFDELVTSLSKPINALIPIRQLETI